MTTAIFDIEKDNAIVASGGFWCECCTGGKPADEQSKDPRYCKSCFKFLLDEAKLLSSNYEKPTRISRPKRPETPPNQNLAVAKPCNPSRIPKQVKQPTGGHPRKKGHKKEIQGVLL